MTCTLRLLHTPMASKPNRHAHGQQNKRNVSQKREKRNRGRRSKRETRLQWWLSRRYITSTKMADGRGSARMRGLSCLTPCGGDAKVGAALRHLLRKRLRVSCRAFVIVRLVSLWCVFCSSPVAKNVLAYTTPFGFLISYFFCRFSGVPCLFVYLSLCLSPLSLSLSPFTARLLMYVQSLGGGRQGSGPFPRDVFRCVFACLFVGLFVSGSPLRLFLVSFSIEFLGGLLLAFSFHVRGQGCGEERASRYLRVERGRFLRKRYLLLLLLFFSSLLSGCVRFAAARDYRNFRVAIRGRRFRACVGASCTRSAREIWSSPVLLI